MKAVITILALVLIVLILAIIGLGMLWKATVAAANSTNVISSITNPLRYYKFDINQVIVDRSNISLQQKFNDFFVQDGEFCSKLKQCIKDSATTYGKYCNIAAMKSTGVQSTIFASGMPPDTDNLNVRCSQEDLTEEVSGVTRKICRFSSTSIQSSDIYYYDSNSPFASFLPNVQGCRPDLTASDFSSVLGSGPSIWESVPQFEGITFDYAETGAFVKIFLSNATPGSDESRTCNYNLFVCIQSGIADSAEDNKTLSLFDSFYLLNQNNLQCCKNGNVNKIFSHQTIYNYNAGDVRPNFYQIISAVDKAFWEWNKVNYENKKLVDNIHGTITDVDKVQFNYNKWVVRKSTSLSYPECYDFAYDSASPSQPEIVYNDKWDGKFSDDNYDNFTVTAWYYFSKQDPSTLIITPRITICRNR